MKKPKPPMPVFETRKQTDLPNSRTEMTAGEKKRIFLAWRRFLASDFSFQHFTKDLYHHLTLHCSFIAHYSRDGFFVHYFDRYGMGEQTVRFIDQFDPGASGRSAEYGHNFQREDWPHLRYYRDLNLAMIEEMGRHAERLRKHVTELRKAVTKARMEEGQKLIDTLEGRPNLL